MKKSYEYFTELNNDQIYIDDRGGRVGRYAVYEDQTVIDDCLNKKKALSLANWLLKEKTKRYKAKEFGWRGNANLMNPATGSVDTASNWASEAHEWSEDERSIHLQFSSLVHVRKDRNGDWIEVK